MAKKLKITANNSSTMYDLAKVFGTTIDELKKYNKLDSNIIKSGQEFYWETDDVEGVKKRLSDLQNYRQAKYEKDKAEYDRVQAAKAKSAQSFKDLHANDEDYGDMTQHQINDYQNFKKQGLGNSIQDFKAYKEREHKSAESTRDLTKKAGYGIVGAAAAMPILANPAGLAHLTRQAATTAVKHAPGMIRDAIVYEKAIDPATTAIADAAGLEGTSRAIFKNGLGFGFSGLGSKVMDRGIIAGLQKLRNSLDDLASRGGIMGRQVTDQMGRNFTKAANAVENVQNQATKVMDPLRTLNAKEAMYDSASAFTKNALAGTAYGAVEEESPLGAAIVAPLTSIGLSKATHGIKRLGWLNSRGAQEAKIIKDTMGEEVAPYTMIYDTTSKTNRQYNGKLVAKRGLQAKGGAQDVMHTPNGEIPLMHKWTSIHKGNTYKSPYWEEVNPQRFMASKMMAPYEGTGWMNRRSYGDTMDFFSPQSYDEFADIAKTSYNKDGQSMYNYLKQDKLKYDLKFNGKDPQGDLIIGKNTNKGIATGSKSDAERLVGYNQKGNRQSAELFTTPEGTQIHLGSDFGGTGSGGSSDVLNRGFMPWLVGRAKASMDLGAYSMPVTGQIQRAKLVNKGKKFSSANVEAYHKNGLPEVDMALAQRKKFHFKNGGTISNVYGL